MLMHSRGKEISERDYDIVTNTLYYDTIKAGGHFANIIKLSNKTLTRSGCPVFLKNF